MPFPFDVILFDVGGVLLTNGWDHGERARAVERFHLNAAELEARHMAIYDAWERDAIAMPEYLDKAVFYEQRPFSREEFTGFLFSQSQPLKDGALGILAEIAASDQCMVGSLNNEARETNEYRFEHYGLRNYFKVSFSSCYLRLRKPEPAIYRSALDILGKPASRILFIDDRPENVQAAIQSGMQAIHFTGATALRAQLNQLGVL